MKNYSEVVQSAQRELKIALDTWSKGGNNSPCSPGVEKVISQCDSYFRSTEEYLTANYETKVSSREKHRMKEKLIRSAGGNFSDFKMYNKKAAYKYTLSKRWRSFSSEYYKEILTYLNGDDAIAILPYLIAAFYINSKEQLVFDKKLPADIENVHNKEKEGNYRRDRKRFLRRFSLEEYVSTFCKKKKSNFSVDVQKINDTEKFKEYLERDYFLVDFKCIPQQPILTSLQYDAVFHAYIYSLCALACMNTETISSRVDFGLSFELFNAHTLAFHSTYIALDVEFFEEELSLFRTPTLLEFLSDPDSALTMRQSINEMDEEDQKWLRSCGVDSRLLCADPKRTSQFWYKNAAILTVANLHPCHYYEWAPRLMHVTDGQMGR